MRLKAERITFQYDEERTILKDVDFAIESGEIVGLVSSSGYGKTTLAKILAGYEKPQRGNVQLEGGQYKKSGFATSAMEPYGSLRRSRRQLSTLLNGRGRAPLHSLFLLYRKRFFPYNKKGDYNPVQMIFQHPEKSVNPLWKMKKIVEEAGEPSKELIEAMGIQEEWMNRWPTELSGGELQRFCVLRILKEKTKFIIADEMTSMLDAITQAQIWSVVIDYAKKHHIGVVVISHDTDLVQRICDRVITLDKAI